MPDLTVWARPQPCGDWLAVTDLVLVVEIVSRGSATMDRIVKPREYADAGISQFWLVERDAGQTVTMYAIGANGDLRVVMDTT